MKETFLSWNARSKSMELIKDIDLVLADYAKQGYKLTLRQLYYQLVSKGLVVNSLKSYSMVGDLVSNARLAGLIDWDMIEDRVRKPAKKQHWESPGELLSAVAPAFNLWRWKEMENYVEVWCEKDAVSNIIEPVCRRWDVLFMANRGYSSQTAMYDGFKRIELQESEGKETHVIYLGDHDPSGMDMTRDVRDRLGLFLNGEGMPYEGVERVALTMEQVRQYNPPENPAKMKDSRYAAYELEFGDMSWELDALEPRVLVEVVEKAIEQYVDRVEFDRVATEEEKGREQIRDVAERFEELTEG